MISFVYSILFGAALAFEKSEHLTVDVWENAKASVQKVFNVIAYTIVLIIIGVFFYYGLMLVSDNLKSGQIVGFLPIKKGYVYMALPISSLFMLYFHVKKVFKWPG
jgi:TRAP-type C4-dicarboxylate transport system permease small subunit